MNNQTTWYLDLIKPTWAPPGWLFGPVWSVLYIIIFASFGFVFYKIWQGEIPRIIALPFALNLLFNFAFTPIQFSLKSNTLAAIDIILVLGTLVWALYLIYPHFKWVALINIPYLLWVCFATVLQLTITYLNW
jgi:translocator protein